MGALIELAELGRFGMKPGLDAIRHACALLGDPQLALKAVHVAGTNGKGAVCAILDSALRHDGLSVGRYTSPHLVNLNERFFLDGRPGDEQLLDDSARRVRNLSLPGLTYFEALTAVAYDFYRRANPDYVILECGLGGRLDATNVSSPILSVITRIGLDHCDWLGDTVEKIAGEKAGIIKPGVPVVLGRNDDSVRSVVESRAREVGAPFHYAPELADESQIPADFALSGRFNRENALTAIAALKVLARPVGGFGEVVWPGRCQRVRNFIVDGAHNPPGAAALAGSLAAEGRNRLNLIAGFCGDKDVDKVLRTFAPLVDRAYAVKTNNARSLPAETTAAKMCAAGMNALACPSLGEALASVGTEPTLIAGSLFLAGEALVALAAYPWGKPRFDRAETLRV